MVDSVASIGDCLINNIKIYIKTAATCFGAVTPSSGSALFVFALALNPGYTRSKIIILLF